MPLIANKYDVPAPQNIVPSGLQRDVILPLMLRAFRRRILPLKAFSTRFNSVPLQGTNELNVPFFPLDRTASRNFHTDGKYMRGDSKQEYRKVVIDNRLYQCLAFTSEEIARQPFLNPEQRMVMKAEKLAEDVIAMIFSAINATNFAKTLTPAIDPLSMDFAFVARAKGLLGKAPYNWPTTGRSMILDSVAEGALIQDHQLGFLNSGEHGAITEGTFPRVAGFEMMGVPDIPENGEGLYGFACFPSALLCGFSPIEPDAAVRALMSAYEALVDPDLGITLEYRRFGDPLSDTAYEIVECNFGFDVGDKTTYVPNEDGTPSSVVANAGALVRIVAPPPDSLPGGNGDDSLNGGNGDDSVGG